MSAKKGRRKIETRTLLYISLVIIIIGAAYIFISSQESTPTYYDPEYVLANSAYFIESGETIIVRGYYDADVVEGGGIVSDYQAVGSELPATGLRLNATAVENVTTKLKEGVLLYFTGHLEYIDPDNVYSDVVFIATEITN